MCGKVRGMKQAPDFTLKDQDGKDRSLTDFRDHWVVLYFYPKDNTPGCTKEACAFRDAREAIAEYGNAVIIGISKDSPESHQKFAKKHGLTFTLLSDPDHAVAAAYDSWDPKFFFGKTLLGTKRNTFLIDPAGNIAKEYHGVDPSIHASEIITDLQQHQNH
ncbi:peroxiredoxin [Candidatus Saccharibacteria bacterium]|nr:MAG: peroxiredoxin [Candidatus Saccharibacteria bacterium]